MKYIKIEVAYAAIDQQLLHEFEVPVGTTAIQAVKLSGIANKFPEIDLDKLSLGIFSRKIKLDTILSVKDRIEIYRPLTIDPMQIRRQRAKLQKSKK